jgi:hypothetical protein
MEIVDYDKTDKWNILGIRDNAKAPAHGYIIVFLGHSGKEIRIGCTPEELQALGRGCLEALEDLGRGPT